MTGVSHDDQLPRLATTPDVPRGMFWNHKGTMMLGYWDLLDAYQELERKYDRLTSGSDASDTDAILKAARVVVAILGAIVEMSDDVKHAASPLDAQGKLLRMQNSIQKNAARIGPYLG
jgi:hypothetical protein